MAHSVEVWRLTREYIPLSRSATLVRSTTKSTMLECRVENREILCLRNIGCRTLGIGMLEYWEEAVW